MKTLTAGDAAPQFSLPCETGENVSLSDFAGKKVLVYFYPKAMTPDARKRLEAIEAAGALGVGFTLATHDREIRGAGELLGVNPNTLRHRIRKLGIPFRKDLRAETR